MSSYTEGEISGLAMSLVILAKEAFSKMPFLHQDKSIKRLLEIFDEETAISCEVFSDTGRAAESGFVYEETTKKL